MRLLLLTMSIEVKVRVLAMVYIKIPFPAFSDRLPTVSYVSFSTGFLGFLEHSGTLCPDSCVYYFLRVMHPSQIHTQHSPPNTSHYLRVTSLELWSNTTKFCHSFLPSLCVSTMLNFIWWCYLFTGILCSPSCLSSISLHTNIGDLCLFQGCTPGS